MDLCSVVMYFSKIPTDSFISTFKYLFKVFISGLYARYEASYSRIMLRNISLNNLGTMGTRFGLLMLSVRFNVSRT